MKAHDLRGIIPALVTPLTQDGSLDPGGCRRLVEHVLAGGIHGVLALGSTGEVHAFDTPMRRRVVEVYAEAIAGRVPLLVGIVRTSLNEALEDIEAAAALGATACLVTPPFYAPLSQRAVMNFYYALADRTRVPVFVYNIPGFTKVTVEPSTIADLAKAGAIVGVKDSSRDFEYLERVVATTTAIPGFRAFVGTDTLLLAALLMGACGAITLSSNVAPSNSVRLYDLYRQGRLQEAREQQFRLLELTVSLRAGPFPAGVKAALAILGICGPTLAIPGEQLSVSERAGLTRALEGAGVLSIPALPA